MLRCTVSKRNWKWHLPKPFVSSRSDTRTRGLRAWVHRRLVGMSGHGEALHGSERSPVLPVLPPDARVAPAAEPSAAAGNKRRRLSVKQSTPPGFPPPVIGQEENAEAPQHAAAAGDPQPWAASAALLGEYKSKFLERLPGKSMEEFRELGRRGQIDWLRNRGRALLWLARQHGMPWPMACADASLRAADTFKQFRARWSKASVVVREGAVDMYKAMAGLPREVCAQQAFRVTAATARTLLLTYVSKEWDINRVTVEPSATVDDVVQAVRASPDFGAWMDSFGRKMVEVTEVTGASHWAWSAEVCPTSWQDARILQVHFHAYLMRPDSSLRAAAADALVFRGAKPHSSWPPWLNRHGRGRLTMWCGYFYCCCDKIGSLMSRSDKLPFVGFPVLIAWVTTLVSAGKLRVGAARTLAARCVTGCARVLQELAAFEQVDQRQRLEQYRRGVDAALSASHKAFVVPGAVREWLRSFDVVEHRYRFLVLDGASRLGKTVFARTLCSPGRIPLELNCAGGAEPNLREFSWFQHGCIIYDEIGPRQVAANRKLFQATDAYVQLAPSSTNMYSYEVFAHRVKMIACSNRWRSELDSMPRQDAAWIEANSVYVRVDAPLWKMD